MIINRLRQETREAHVSLERRIVPLLKQISTVTDYQQVLKLFFGYFKPLEMLVMANVDRAMIVDIDKRRKTELLQQDLQHTGSIEIRELVTQEKLPSIANPYSALGALYVMEGSTLGGAIISKMIRQRLPNENISIRFFEGYGDKSESMWEQFLSQINAVDYSEENALQLIEAAKETFLRFEEWTIRFTQQQNSSSRAAQRA